jgi:hypothetical protein
MLQPPRGRLLFLFYGNSSQLSDLLLLLLLLLL